MTADRPQRRRCAVYTRKSSEEGLEQAFNSLDAQRESCEAYIKSQVGEGWQLVRAQYDDGGFSGGTLERPALQQLLGEIQARRVDIVVVYKVDRLTRSLAGFAKIVEVFDACGVSFVSVTQQFNTTTSMGRLTLNMLLSFAQFEREVTGERIRDKIAASKKKGMWMGGFVPLGYDAEDRILVINQAEAETVRTVFRLYQKHGNVRQVKAEADRLGLTTKIRLRGPAKMGGRPLSRGHIYRLLGNPIYAGRIVHKAATYEGQHEAIIDEEAWDTVQAMLADHTHARRSGAGAREPSLLAGLIRDASGNRLSPSHAVKKGVRYRYYVSQAVLQHRDLDAGQVVRIPAREIEEVVGAQIRALLTDAHRLIDEILESDTPRTQQRLIARAAKLAERWPTMNASDRRAFLLRVQACVTVGEGQVTIVVDRGAFRHALRGDAPSRDRVAAEHRDSRAFAKSDVLAIDVPARLKFCSGVMRLVIPPGHAAKSQPRPSAVLIKAVTRAHRWRHRLFSGEASSIQAIANEEGLNERYVGRILRLAFFAPDIVEAILDGRQPADLDLDRLLKVIPLAWADQRKVFGFQSSEAA